MAPTYMPVKLVGDVVVNSIIEEEEDVGLRKQINCKQCVKIFKSKPLLRTHVTKMHPLANLVVVKALVTRKFTDRTNFKGFPCSELSCKNYYTSIKSMKDHIKREHEEETVACGVKQLDGSLCDLSFTRVGVHRKSHDKSIRYKCDYCEVYFASMGSVNRHKNDKHVVKQQCGYCPKKFVSDGNLNAHREKVHMVFKDL